MILQQHGHALGSDVSWTVVVDDKKIGELALRHIRNFIDAFQERLSRFLPESELSRINSRAGEWVGVSPESHDFLAACMEMQNYTNGLFSPLLLGEVQRAGYVGSWPHPTDLGDAPDLRDRYSGISDEIELRDGKVKIPSHSALDSGGIGKGYALDQIADLLESDGINNYWVSLGGDIIARGHDDEGQSWHIALGEIGDGNRFVTIPNNERVAVATSTILKRRGDGWHHLIDPRTGYPAETPLVTVSVVAKSGVLADVIAKCVLIAGSEAKQFWQSHKQQQAFIMKDTNEVEEL